MATPIKNASLDVLQVLSDFFYVMGSDSRTLAYNLEINARKVGEDISVTSFSDYVVSRGRREHHYDKFDMNASGAAFYPAKARDLALVNLHRKMERKGIEKIVDVTFKTDNIGEIGYPAYRVTARGIGVSVNPNFLYFTHTLPNP